MVAFLKKTRGGEATMHELKRAEIVEAFGERVKELGWIGLDMAIHPETGPFAVRSLFEKVRHPSYP